MKKTLMAGAFALASLTGVAQAATVITSPATLNLVNFGTGNGNGLQAAATATASTMGMVFTPGLAGVFSGSSAGTNSTNGFTSPLAGNANYLAVQPNGLITFTFAAAQTSFGLLIGTIDSYNSLSFTGTSGTQTYSGSDIVNALGGSANGSTTRNVLFTGLNAFTTVTASDTTFSAFEFVPAVTAAVPEPAAWGMMILGFGLVGGVMRRRSSAKVNVRFA